MLICLLIYLLISNAISLKYDKSILFSRVVIKTLLYASFIVLNNLHLHSLDKGIGIYGGLFHITPFTQTFNIFIFLISGIILTLTAFYPRKLRLFNNDQVQEKGHDLSVFSSDNAPLSRWGGGGFYSKFLQLHHFCDKDFILNKNAEQFRIIEYGLIIVFILCGAVFLISTSDLISMFLSIELQSYGLYILSTIYRNSESATAGGLTYFLLGGLSSCFILLGSSLLYANSGTTQLDSIYVISSISDMQSSYSHDLGVSALMYWYQPYYLHSALIIMLVGFLFKVSAAPFHFWSPDVYDGIPTIVTTYVAIVAKISIFAMFMELVYYTEHYFFDFSWKSILLLSSLFSLIIGSVLGLSQFRIKRLYAYSTISHVGFILLALSINSTESIESYIFYILQYSLSNLNAFLILISVGYSLYFYTYKGQRYKETLVDKNNSPIQLISQMKGYFNINPFIATSLVITLLSFIGIPPAIGFFAKQMILSAALDNGYVFMALVAIITSVIGAAYYLNLIKQIFFYESDYESTLWIHNSDPVVTIKATDNIRKFFSFLTGFGGNAHNASSKTFKEISIKLKQENITLSASLSIPISVISLLLILFIYVPEEWFNVVSILTLILFKA